MSDGPVPAPREQGWIGIVLALAAFLLLPHAPGVSALLPLPALMPVLDTLLLFLPVLTVCFVVGWWAGGSLSLALVWLVLTAWLFILPAPRGVSQAYYDLARGWGLLVAGAFGIVCLLGAYRSFLHRALSAIGVATLLSLLLVAFGRLDLRQAQQVFADEFVGRDSVAIAGMRETAREVTTWIPTATEVANHVLVGSERVQQVLSRLATPLYPALLALEALAACALAWALYHRLSRARLGAALGPVRSFTFSDQLAWALIAGITMLLVPSLAALALVGLNLVVFFGALYVLRGYGIYAWIVSRRAAVTSLVVAIALYPVSLVTVPAALGLGLTDTVLDWRKRLTTSTTGQGGASH